MLQRFLIIADGSVADETVQDLRAFSTDLATYIGESIGLAVAGKSRLAVIRAALLSAGGAQHLEEIAPRAAASAAPMSSADFIWREDGRPDWAAMWTGFCELALYGGPPHRGEDSALRAPDPIRAAAPLADGFDPIAEIRRGIWETTGLIAEPADEPGWISVTCDSIKMAAWLCATIILENVDARCDEERLLLPAATDFKLKDEVKSIITVLAKTHHYWQAHVEAQEAGAPVGAAS
jgi:sirohydrochlorin cobaltochelatase